MQRQPHWFVVFAYYKNPESYGSQFFVSFSKLRFYSLAGPILAVYCL